MQFAKRTSATAVDGNKQWAEERHFGSGEEDGDMGAGRRAPAAAGEQPLLPATMDDSSGGSGSFSSSSAPKTNWKSIYIIAVVAFITSLEFAASNDWNYFCQLETTATITFYGILRTVGGISGGIFTILAGWICNKLRDTREVLLVSKMLIFVAFCFFLSVELVHGFLFYAFFLIYKLLTGIANGGGGMSRTHVAMASTEADRAKAIALTSLFPAVGLLIGFSINAASSFMKYPGIEVPVIGIHLNLFTAPMLFNMLIFGVAFYLLLFHFDGKWHNYEQSHRHELAKKKNSFMVLTPAAAANGGWVNPQPMMDKTPLPPTIKSARARLQALVAEHFPCGQFDWVGVCLCLFTQLVVSLAMLNLLTINAPYQQLAFEWDAAQLQFFGGLTGAAVAIQLIFWPAAYMTFGLNKIISERNSIICALGVLMANYLLTYSWPFLGETLHYAAQHVFENHGNGTASALVSDVPVSNCGSQSQPGCPSHYQWCASTTKPIMAVYLTSTILSIGMAMPILRMNLDILYSKMLGNIKQGVMQGLFFSCQIGLEMAGGPIIISWVFERTGPKHIWEFIGTSLAICLLLWAVFYKRMISNSDWHSQKEKLLPAAVGKSAISPSFSN